MRNRASTRKTAEFLHYCEKTCRRRSKIVSANIARRACNMAGKLDNLAVIQSFSETRSLKNELKEVFDVVKGFATNSFGNLGEFHNPKNIQDFSGTVNLNEWKQNVVEEVKGFTGKEVR